MDSHGAQWSNIIIPYAHKNNYVLLQIYYRDDIICNKKYIMLNTILNKYKPLKLFLLRIMLVVYINILQFSLNM